MKRPCHFLGATLGFAAILLSSGCTAPPPEKHKPASGGARYNKWGSYEGKRFSPVDAQVTAVDVKAGVVSITGKNRNSLQVSPQTRIMHNGTDITLAQLPANAHIKYTLSEDGGQVLTIWYGRSLNEHRGGGQPAKAKTTFY